MKHHYFTISKKIEYRQGLLNFRASSDIGDITYEWRIKLDEEIDRLDKEINPPTVGDIKAQA